MIEGTDDEDCKTEIELQPLLHQREGQETVQENPAYQTKIMFVRHPNKSVNVGISPSPAHILGDRQPNQAQQQQQQQQNQQRQNNRNSNRTIVPTTANGVAAPTGGNNINNNTNNNNNNNMNNMNNNNNSGARGTGNPGRNLEEGVELRPRIGYP